VFCGVRRFWNRCLQTQVLFACKQKHCPWALCLACAANMPSIESQQIVPDDPRDCMELRLKATVCTSTYRTPSASSVQTYIRMCEVWITSWYLHTDASSHEQGEVWRVANYLHPSLQAFIWPSSPSLFVMLERCSVVSRRAETFIWGDPFRQLCLQFQISGEPSVWFIMVTHQFVSSSDKQPRFATTDIRYTCQVSQRLAQVLKFHISHLCRAFAPACM